MSNRLEEVEKSLGVTFENRELLRTALIHRSYINERSGSRVTNERLEFLGDAVLSVIVANHLFHNYPDRTEGELTDLRSALVRRETLAKWALELNLGKHLFLGKGEAQTGGRTRAQTLAGVFEAVLGALFVERGLEGATEWFMPIMLPELEAILAEGRHYDYKGLLQKVVQQRYGVSPTYHVVGESGLEHERIFEIEARAETLALGRGNGMTKQVGQQAAAKAGLAYLESLPLEVTTEITDASEQIDTNEII